MFLSRFGVKNYKCLGEIDIPLTPIHVLIGENDAGKTSLLEAMVAFHAVPESPWDKVFPLPSQGCELVRHGTQERSICLLGEWVAFEGEQPPGTHRTYGYELSLHFKREGRTFDWHVEWTTADGDTRSVPESSSHVERSRIGQGMMSEVESAGSVIRKPAAKYALTPRQMAMPAAFDQERKLRLDPDGFGLATLLDDILGFDPELFLQLRSQFCGIFPQFKNLQISTEYALRRQYDKQGMPRSDTTQGKAIYVEMRTGDRIRIQQASDGVILFLGFLALAHLPDPPNLLLIEEPENCVYPRRLGEVIKLLKDMVNRTEGVRFPQIIISTHSPYVLSFFKPEEVTFLSRPPDRPDGPVRARPLRDAPNIRERLADGFYLGELWYNLSEEDLFGGS